MARILCAVAFLGWFAVAANSSQPPQPGQRAARCEPAEVQLKDSGIRDCLICHNTREQRPESTDFIRVNESVTFEKNDPHVHAYEVLTGELGRRMSDALGYDVAKCAECLTCHSVTKRSDNSTLFVAQYGVSCEVCHGWRTADWYGAHSIANWRTKTPAEKMAKGQIDLRDPATRAAKCVSCHVGNLAEGKFVTHEMYAAGHPPLLPFEQATFGRDQPAHWDRPEDVTYLKNLDADAALKLFHVRKGESSTARSLAVGALVNLRESARLLADAAAATPANETLDFAHFDCFACHHELQSPSARQERGYSGAAGRPTMRPLPTELVTAVLRHAETNVGQTGRATQLQGAADNLAKAFTARPFGDTAAIATAARTLQNWASGCLVDLEQVKYSDKAGDLLACIAAPPDKAWDYDAAQLMTWAGRALAPDDGRWRPLKPFVLMGAGIPPGSNASEELKKRLVIRYGFAPTEFQKKWAAAQ